MIFHVSKNLLGLTLCHNVRSQNTHMTFADKLWLVLSHSTHSWHSHTTSKIPRTPSPNPVHGSYQVLTLFPVYSFNLTSCYLPPLHSCVCHSCVYCLSHFKKPQLMAMLSDSIYKTLNSICIQHV